MGLVVEISGDRQRQPLLDLVMVLAIAFAIGTIAVSMPLLLALGLAAAAGGYAYRQPSYLLGATMLMSLAVLQSSDGLSRSKLIFLASYILVSVRAVSTFYSSRETADKRSDQLAALSAAFLAVPIALSLPVSLLSQISITSWVRDSAPYIQLALVPIIALGFSRLVSQKFTTWLISAIALLGSVSFSLSWLARRGVMSFDTEIVGLASVSLAALGMSFFLVKALTSERGTALWAFAAIICVSLVAITGTRSAVVLLIPIPVVLIAYRADITTVKIRALIAALAISAVALMAFANIADIDQTTVADRWRSLSGGVGDIALNDPSYSERATQWKIAWSSFADHPTLGRGLGFTYGFEVQYGSTIQSRGGFVLDTPITFLSKYGLVGIAGLALSIGALMRLIRHVGPTRESAVILVAYLASTAAYALLVNPLEDKGFSIGLTLLLIYVLATSRRATRGGSQDLLIAGVRHTGSRTPTH